MSTIRCTGKLLKRLRIDDPGEAVEPSNALGDWYANIIYTREGHYVVLVSERSRLPVIISARGLSDFPRRFLRMLGELLILLGIDRHRVERELEAMQPLYLGKTASRSVVGSLSDFASLFKHRVQVADLSIVTHGLELADTLCGPLNMEAPAEVTRRLLQNPHGFSVIHGGDG